MTKEQKAYARFGYNMRMAKILSVAKHLYLTIDGAVELLESGQVEKALALLQYYSK